MNAIQSLMDRKRKTIVIPFAAPLMLIFAGWLTVLIGFGWAAAGVAAAAMLLGTRHAFDADHIASIDNVVRKLAEERKDSHSVGLFFSLGHSTIVMVFMLLVGLAGNSFYQQYNSEIGAITTVATVFVAGFLSLVAIVNFASLATRVQGNNPKGFLHLLFPKLMNTISRQKDMYLVGFIFGLGLDTAFGLLLIASASISLYASLSVPLWVLTVSLGLLFAGSMAFGDSLGTHFANRAYAPLGSPTSGWGERYRKNVTLLVASAATLVAVPIWLNLFGGIDISVPGLEYLGLVLVGLSVISVFLYKKTVSRKMA